MYALYAPSELFWFTLHNKFYHKELTDYYKFGEYMYWYLYLPYALNDFYQDNFINWFQNFC